MILLKNRKGEYIMGNFFASRKAKIIISSVSLLAIVAVGVTLGVANNLAFGKYSATISHYLAPSGDPQSSDAQQARNMGNQLAREIEREGVVMLENNGTLPFDRSVDRVCVFGHGSVDWTYMSSGSEMVGMNGQTGYDLCGALKNKNIEVFDPLQAYYLKWHAAKPDSMRYSTLSANFEEYYQIREPSLETDEEYKDLYNQALDFSDTAFMVLERRAGENSDCPHYQNKVNGQDKDEERTYLQISTEEEYTLRQIAEDFDNVVVVINSTNAMQLDFVQEIEGIDACISVGATGVQGALSIPELLWGEACPSGHLTDTYPYDHKYNVTYFRGNAKFTHQYQGGKAKECATMGSGGSAFYRTSCYVEYTEGIYVGYRWFETADVEGFWDDPQYGGYENVVQYPFGYGMSYTTFDWTLKGMDEKHPEGTNITNKDVITLTVNVKNTGNYAGKDVIEVYLTAPYTPGGIEKSSVKLVAYAKTPELKPGQAADIDIEVDCKEFKSYDCYDDNDNGFCGYEMEEGDYVLRLQTDAHNLKDMDKNTITYRVNEDIEITEDEKTGNTVENRFTGEDAYEEMPIDGSSVEQGIEFIHRNNFPPLLTEVEENKDWTDLLLKRGNGIVAPKGWYTAEQANAWDNAEEDYFGNPVDQTKPTWGSTNTNYVLLENGGLSDIALELSSNEGYDNPLWEDVLDQVVFSEAKNILEIGCSWNSPGVASIGLRTNADAAFEHGEGASQVGNGYMAKDTDCVGYPGSTVLSQTWNQVLAYMFGKSEGNDMGPAGKDALYSPACNIHRSPYGGRNSGYQSEDPYLSGRVVGNIVKGFGVYGKIGFVKHFIVNDQDFNRMGLYTWLNEQALREIYLRTFEETVKYGDNTAIMTSFNRLGGIWAGGNEALIQGVLRYEWGFKGQIITDMIENGDNMDKAAGLRAGGNINLGSDTPVVALSTSSTGRVQRRMRQAIKEIAFSYCHALYKNHEYNAAVDDPAEAIIVSEPKRAYQWWRPALVSIDAAVYAILGFLTFVILDKTYFHISGKKEKKED